MSEQLDPQPLFVLIAAHVPADLHRNILVVGSLAAAFHHRDKLRNRSVNTKDADVIVQPAGAIEECRRIVLRLLDSGWRRHEKCRASPADTPTDELRAIRLLPPDTNLYFVELLAFPRPDQTAPKEWTRCTLDDGDYGLPSFRFMGVTAVERQAASTGLYYAHPSMMALANLLAHPRVGPETMSEPIGGRTLRRADKDLGRVLALARLDDREATEAWVPLWIRALNETQPGHAQALASTLGDGLRQLVSDDGFLDEARHAVEVGLLNGFGVTRDQLRALGRQFDMDVVEPVRRAFGS